MNQYDNASAESLDSYPNIRAAAELLGVSASTLSRRPDLRAEGRGERDRVLRASEVLRLAGIYRRRSLNDVAAALIEVAQEASPRDAERVAQEVEAFFEERTVSYERLGEFLALAQRLLPPSLYEQVERAVKEQGIDDALIGYLPPPTS